MDSSLTHKIIKARQYAGEPGRIHIQEMEVRLDGDDRQHLVGLKNREWSCDCEYFGTHLFCAHTMAMERVLKDMLTPASSSSGAA